MGDALKHVDAFRWLSGAALAALLALQGWQLSTTVSLVREIAAVATKVDGADRRLSTLERRIWK